MNQKFAKMAEVEARKIYRCGDSRTGSGCHQTMRSGIELSPDEVGEGKDNEQKERIVPVEILLVWMPGKWNKISNKLTMYTYCS